MSHTHENRPDIAARSNRHADFVFGFRIQDRRGSASLPGKNVQSTSAVKQLFRYTDRRNIEHHPHVGRQPAALTPPSRPVLRQSSRVTTRGASRSWISFASSSPTFCIP